MKRENLYLVGGALLASTALSTAADAATLTLRAAPLVANAPGTVRPLSAQVFAATPSSAATLGPATIVMRFNQIISSKFQSVLSLTNAKFVTTSVLSAQAVEFGTNGSITQVGNSIACTATAATDKIILDCDPTGLANAGGVLGGSLNGVFISNVSFDNATALATAGTSAAMSATITVASVLFETAPDTNLITGTNSLVTTSTATAGVANVNVNSTPTAFTNFVGGSTTVTIATINITGVGAVGRDLFTLVGASGKQSFAGATSNIKLTSAIFTDDAATRVNIVGATNTYSRTSTAFAGGSVTFTLAAGSIIEPYTVTVEFNGKSQIDAAAAGSVDVTFAASGQDATSTSSNLVAPPNLTGGGLAGLSRGGLNVDINHIQPGTAQGEKVYTSLLRINNTSSFAGSVTVVLRNDATGAALGTFTSASIPAGASIQVSAAQLEAGAGITPNASVLYRATVSGAINGYVQHVNWNQDAGFFSDLSANR